MEMEVGLNQQLPECEEEFDRRARVADRRRGNCGGLETDERNRRGGDESPGGQRRLRRSDRIGHEAAELAAMF